MSRRDIVLIVVAALLAGAVFLGLVAYDQYKEQQSDITTWVVGEDSGILTDLPRGWQSFVVHQRNGYTWLVVQEPNGNIAVVPYLDADGEQHQNSVTDNPYE